MVLPAYKNRHSQQEDAAQLTTAGTLQRITQTPIHNSTSPLHPTTMHCSMAQSPIFNSTLLLLPPNTLQPPSASSNHIATLSVVLVNPLTTIWKWEVDLHRRQVCAATASPPPILADVDPENLEDGSSPHWRTTERPMRHGGPHDMRTTPRWGTMRATEQWLRVTGQDVRVDKSCSLVQGEDGAPAILLKGHPSHNGGRCFPRARDQCGGRGPPAHRPRVG